METLSKRLEFLIENDLNDAEQNKITVRLKSMGFEVMNEESVEEEEVEEEEG